MKKLNIISIVVLIVLGISPLGMSQHYENLTRRIEALGLCLRMHSLVNFKIKEALTQNRITAEDIQKFVYLLDVIDEFIYKESKMNELGDVAFRMKLQGYVNVFNSFFPNDRLPNYFTYNNNQIDNTDIEERLYQFLQSQNIEPREIDILMDRVRNEYLKAPGKKAIAWDKHKDGAYSYGFATFRMTQEEANRAALRYCNQKATRGVVVSSCRLCMIGDEIVY